MRERLAEVATREGAMETFVASPELGGRFPAVVLFMDVWGLREELFDIARRVAAVGYTCAVPDFYHRLGRGVGTSYWDAKQRMVSLHNLDQATQDEVLKPMLALSDAQVVADVGALIGFLASESARTDAMGAIGWCMGGRHALQAAGHHAGHFRATAALHGTRLVYEGADSTHLLAGQFRGEVYCGFGAKDHYTPQHLIAAFGEAMRASPVRYDFLVHVGCEHGYALPDRDIYDKHAANRDWERIFAMFRRQLSA